jgi:hypothetical protein
MMTANNISGAEIRGAITFLKLLSRASIPRPATHQKIIPTIGQAIAVMTNGSAPGRRADLIMAMGTWNREAGRFWSVAMVSRSLGRSC